MSEETEPPSARQAAILEAAALVFSRYGPRKTSMDDVARAAGLSRQGLYLHYATKDALFRAVVLHLVGQTRATCEAVLADPTLDVIDKVLDTYTAMHATLIASAQGGHMAELIAAAHAVVGPAVQTLEERLQGGIAAALEEAGVADRWVPAGISTRDLVMLLDAASRGLKHASPDLASYRERMGVVVRAVCVGRA